MAGETIQQIVDYLKANPEAARKAKEYVMAHPGDVKNAIKDIAEKRGWDLSKIDVTALKSEIGKMMAA